MFNAGKQSALGKAGWRGVWDGARVELGEAILREPCVFPLRLE